MAWLYKFIDHTADIAIEVQGDNYDELFKAAASAWYEIAVESSSHCVQEGKKILISELTLEELLVSFLSELNYLLYHSQWITEKINKISLEHKNNIWEAVIGLCGFPLDESKHNIKAEIKAVTFHQMKIENVEGKYITKIIFDI